MTKRKKTKKAGAGTSAFVAGILTRVDALERADGVSDTAVGLLSENIKRLEKAWDKRVATLQKSINKTDVLMGELAANIARVDNRLTNDRLKEIKAGYDALSERVMTAYEAHQQMLADLADVRTKIRLCAHETGPDTVHPREEV